MHQAITTDASNGGTKEVPEISSIKVEDDSEDDNRPMEPREAIVRSVPSIELPDGKTSGFKARPVFEQCFYFQISDNTVKAIYYYTLAK